MTRLMYDSVNPWAIPADAVMVAPYVDCSFAWTAAALARFPNAVKAKIAAGCNPQDAPICDVENGDYLPWEAVDFALVQRAKGIDPTCYVNMSNWNPTRTEFRLRGVPEPHWWLAFYDGVATIPAGCVAKQYANSAMTGGNYDLSIVADFWPGVDTAFGPGGGALGDDFMAALTDAQQIEMYNGIRDLNLGLLNTLAVGGVFAQDFHDRVVEAVKAAMPATAAGGLTQQQVTDAVVAALKTLTLKAD